MARNDDALRESVRRSTGDQDQGGRRDPERDKNGSYYCVGDEAWFPKFKTVSKHESFEEACRIVENGGDSMADDPGYRAFLQNMPRSW